MATKRSQSKHQSEPEPTNVKDKMKAHLELNAAIQNDMTKADQHPGILR